MQPNILDLFCCHFIELCRNLQVGEALIVAKDAVNHSPIANNGFVVTVVFQGILQQYRRKSVYCAII